MAVMLTCDPCKALGSPEEEEPTTGTITEATEKTPTVVKVFKDDGTFTYEIQLVDTCTPHHELSADFYMRLGLSSPDIDLTGWEPQEVIDEFNGSHVNDIDLDELSDGDVNPDDLGMDEEDAEAVKEHVDSHTEEPTTAEKAVSLKERLLKKATPAVKPAVKNPTPSNDLKLIKGHASAVRQWADVAGEKVAAKGAIPQAVLIKFRDASPQHEKYFEKA